MVMPINDSDEIFDSPKGRCEIQFVQMNMTSGVAQLLSDDGCGWLLECIASHEAVDEKVGKADFKIWTVERGEGSSGVQLSCWIDIDRDRPSGEQPDGLLIASQHIEQVRFPFDSVRLDAYGRFALFSENGVLALPEER